MKRMTLLGLGAAVIAIGMWTAKDGGGRAAPDDRIAAHGRALCKIAEQGQRAPLEGVQRMFRYHGDHGPHLARDWAELLVLIERIPDDDAHDARARQAAKRIREPMKKCERTFERFARAIEADPEASALLERGMTRLSRTLEILFGKDAAGWSPMVMPDALERLAR